MRLILSIVFLAVCLAVAASKRCDTEDDCGEGECCASSSKDLSKKGRCLKLGRIRARCNAPGAKLDYYGGKFASYCPCEEGLECDTGKTENGFGRCKSTAEEPNPDEDKPEPEEEPEEPEPEAGPGGEKPRDDDCADWELPC